MQNQVVWFDIPVTNLDRAAKFYATVLATNVDRHTAPGMAMGILAHDENAIGGCLFQMEGQVPSATGPLLYFNAGGRLNEAIASVAPCGGKVLQPKHSIAPHGFRAVVLDSEGNRIALHAQTDG